MNKARMSQKLSTGLFAIPIICLLLTLIIVLTFFLINPITVGVPVDIPKVKELKLLESGPPTIITLSKNGRLFINDIKLEQDIIPQRALSALRNKRVYLRPYKDVKYEKILKVLEQLKKENIKVSFVGKTDSSVDIKISKSNTSRKSFKNIPPPPQPISQKISSETVSKIQNHVKKCWSIIPGSLDIKTSIILKISLNEDMSVSKVDVKDKEKYFNNSKYKVIANGAKRAVLACSPLPLNNTNYAILKEFEMEFNTNFMNVR
jgi:biopolymer transport protein ExbD